MRTPLMTALTVAAALACPPARAASEGAALVERRFVRDSPSADATGSMPVGNGDLAANVYVAGGRL